MDRIRVEFSSPKFQTEAINWQEGDADARGGRGGGGARGTGIFTFTKYVDEAAHTIANLCLNATPVPSVVMTISDDGRERMRITLDEVRVEDVSMSGGAHDVPTQTVKLHAVRSKTDFPPR